MSLEAATLAPEWQEEIGRRLEEIENGEAIFYDAEAVVGMVGGVVGAYVLEGPEAPAWAPRPTDG